MGPIARDFRDVSSEEIRACVRALTDIVIDRTTEIITTRGRADSLHRLIDWLVGELRSIEGSG